jgi:hypothetical protein
MSDAKPYSVRKDDLANVWYVEGPGGNTMCGSEDEACEECSVYNQIWGLAFASAAASRDGEVGRYKAAWDAISEFQNKDCSCSNRANCRACHERVMCFVRYHAASALAPGNGGEGEP